MKITITIENGTTKIEVDDEQPIAVTKVQGEVVVTHPASEAIVRERGAPITRNSKRACDVCGKDITGYHPKAKVCSDECRKEKAKRYSAKYHGRVPTVEKPDDPEVEWCKKCQAWTTHNTKSHVEEPFTLDPTAEPQFLPGHEKSEEEIASWAPKPILPGQPGYSSTPRDDTEKGRQPK